MQGLILTCVCCVLSEMLHITSIQMCNNPDIEIHTVSIVFGRKTECTVIRKVVPTESGPPDYFRHHIWSPIYHQKWLGLGFGL